MLKMSFFIISLFLLFSQAALAQDDHLELISDWFHGGQLRHRDQFRSLDAGWFHSRSYEHGQYVNYRRDNRLRAMCIHGRVQPQKGI